jgi:hypothetical protein
MVFNNSILLGAAGQGGVAPFDTTLIGNSVWLDGSADGLTAPSSTFSAQDGKEFTLGTWIQLNQIGVSEGFFCAGASPYTSVRHDSDNKIYFQTEAGSAILKTQAIFRDFGWYHVLVSVDTTQSAASDRVRLFVNGTEQTLDGTQPSVNHAYEFNTAVVHEVGDSFENGAFKGYLAQSFMIGSKSIQQGDFAITDFLDTFTLGTNGSQFIPKAHTDIKTLVDTGSSNSFLLQYENSSALGTDSSTNTNTFTATSMGSANQSENTPSNLYPIINIIDHSNTTLPTISEGNLRSAGPGAGRACLRTTIPIPTTGKWYWEAKWNSVASARIGFAESNSQLLDNCGQSALSWGIQNDGTLVNNNSSGSVLFSWSTNDIIAMAYDADASKFWFGRIASGTTSVTWASSGNPETGANATVTSVPTQITPALDTNTGDVSLFFPEEDWTLSSKLSGFKEINSANLTAPNYQGIDYFDATIYEGNGTGQRVGDFVPFTDSYTVDNSAMFEEADKRYLSFTPSAGGDQKTFTFSTWFKLTGDALGQRNTFLCTDDGSKEAVINHMGDQTNKNIKVDFYNGSSFVASLTTDQEIRRQDQWYHLVVAVDTRAAVASANKIKIYINGVLQTTSGTALSTDDYETEFNSENEHNIGRQTNNGIGEPSWYLAETVMVEGSQLAATSFGQVDTSTNRWIPKDVSGLTFGDEGWYLEYEGTFNSGVAATGAGKDSSGNGNHWAEQNDSGSAWATSDQFTDTPSKNYPVVDGGNKFGSVSPAVSEGNLRFAAGGDGGGREITMQPTSGKWYFEIELTNTTGFYPGLITPAAFAYTGSAPWNETSTFVILSDHPSVRYNNGGTSGSDWGAVFSNGDRMAVAWDVPNKKIYFGKAASSSVTWMSASGASGGNPATGVGAVPFTPPNERLYFAMMFGSNSTDATIKFISSGWEGAAPTGFSELNQDNLDDTASKITVWSWIKNRDATDSHILVDRIRGVGKTITSDETSPAVQQTNINTVQRFLQRGVQIGNDVTVNTANESYVLWQWLAGDSATTGSTTSPAGTIASTTIVADAGHFSVGSYTGNGTDNSTVGHGLGAIPEMIIVRNLSRLTYGLLWHKDGYVDGGTGDPSEFVMDFARAINFAANNEKFGGSDETYPTANVFKIGDHNEINANTESLVFYAFRSVPGVCKVGVYHGNGNADGAYVSVGFRPRWVMIKSNRNARDFVVADTTRHPTNVVGEFLYPSSNAVESARGVTSGSDYDLDILSDGFKLRCADGALNDSTSGSSSYMYIAMAEIGGNGTLPPIYGR